MKILLPLFVLAISSTCSAQTIVPLFDGPIDLPENAYLKDIDNDLNPFEGEWRWEEGNSSWTIQLQKFEMVYDGDHYWDKPASEYRIVAEVNSWVVSMRMRASTMSLGSSSLRSTSMTSSQETQRSKNAKKYVIFFMISYP